MKDLIFTHFRISMTLLINKLLNLVKTVLLKIRRIMELDEFLKVKSDVSDTKETLGYSFDTDNERGVVNNVHLKDFSFNKATGGTITLGGVANGNGVMQILNASGGTVVTANNSGITINSGSITINDSSGSSVIDSMGIVNSSLITNSAVTKTGGFDQIISGTAETPLNDGTISFVLDRAATCLFMVDASVWEQRASGTADYNAYGKVQLFIDDVEYNRAVVGGGYFEVNGGVRGNGETTIQSCAVHYMKNIASAGTHTFVVKASQEILDGVPEMGVHIYNMTYIRIGA